MSQPRLGSGARSAAARRCSALSASQATPSSCAAMSPSTSDISASNTRTPCSGSAAASIAASIRRAKYTLAEYISSGTGLAAVPGKSSPVRAINARAAYGRISSRPSVRQS
ncbi:hypothetical protein D9M68_395140 [compost metagenome]